MAIYITGDTHGDIDLRKLKKEGFAAQEGDYVIICGDFGAVWDDSKEDKNLQEWYNNQPWTTLFCDGNHENFDLLSKYPVEEWSGGKVHRIGPKILHLMRGQVFTIEGKKFFVMGGAQSHDMTFRIPGKDWWAEEMPSYREVKEGYKNLIKNSKEVDYIITHCAPTYVVHLINPWYKGDGLTEFFEGISLETEFKHWYCGHYHIDADFINNISVLYDRIIKL